MTWVLIETGHLPPTTQVTHSKYYRTGNDVMDMQANSPKKH